MDEALDSAINDTLSCLYTIVYCASSLVSPIIGGKLYDELGWKPTTQIAAATCLLLAIIYFVFNCGFSVFQDYKHQVKVLDELKQLKLKLSQSKS